MEDLDSILDDCLALGMPQTYLEWHYRSKHESLIAFSNYEFYENKMLTFPSKNDREKRVNLKKLDGFFDRGKSRVNQVEAEAIIQEIKLRYNDVALKEQSIGVVTFNISQQILIQDMLAEEFQRDTNFDEWANSGEEELLVKNLENVQGDERDVILFSIAFGPDTDGKLSMNFGPLNKDGGWKRLNVAVSRARYEMIVYSIMTADMIDLRRTKSKGVEALRNFLEFADKGNLQGTTSESAFAKQQGIVNSLCHEITEAGFEYRTAVGHSRFKIDIAVVNPYNKDEYLLGIMLDGESYRQSKNTKDREVSQMGVLEFLGWDVQRLWTMDWWDNRDKEIHKILQILNDKKIAASEVVLQAKIEESITDGQESNHVDTECIQTKLMEETSDDEATIYEVEERLIKDTPQEVSFGIKYSPMDNEQTPCVEVATMQSQKTELKQVVLPMRLLIMFLQRWKLRHYRRMIISKSQLFLKL